MAEVKVMTHSDENLTDCFVAYLIYKKRMEHREVEGFDVEMAVMTALGGLDREYSSGEYLMKMKADFERIALRLEEMAKRLYKEQAKSEGKKDKMEVESLKFYSVYDAAQYHRVTEETIRKAIRENRIKAEGKPYRISESEVKNFVPKGWQRKD